MRQTIHQGTALYSIVLYTVQDMYNMTQPVPMHQGYKSHHERKNIKKRQMEKAKAKTKLYYN